MLRGRIEKEDVVALDKDAIDELYSTSFYGRPRKDRLEVTFIEAAYLLYRNKIGVESGSGEHLDFRDFMIFASGIVPDFEIKYLVYKDMRERGYFIQPGVTDFRVYPRGGSPGKTPAEFFIYAISERKTLKLSDLTGILNTADNLKKRMVLAIVDEESDITFYELNKTVLKSPNVTDVTGITDVTDLARMNAGATLLSDRVIVWSADASAAFHQKFFFGNPLDEEHLQLSLVESGYLLKKSMLSIKDMAGNSLDFNGFSERAAGIEPEFGTKFTVYEKLRDSGLIAKTGFKFGAHFRVYKTMDEKTHAEYLVHVIPHDFVFSLQPLSRAIRLANSVRKKMIFAYTDAYSGGEVRYIEIGWMKL